MNKIEYINKYQINLNNHLGTGTFSNVYRGLDGSGSAIAIKIIKKSNKNKYDKMIMNEISILKLLKSAYIINLIDFIEVDNKYYLFLELASNSLFDIMHHIKINEIFIYLKQLLKCLIYIQSFNIVHNDIKPANILIQYIDNNNFRLKLCDFGMSADMDNNHNFFCGSPIFMNLDRLKGNYNSNSDFWAIKIIYYYMVYGRHPFEGATNIKELISLINRGIKIYYNVDIHTNLLQELFSNTLLPEVHKGNTLLPEVHKGNSINTPHELLTKIELIENDLLNDINDNFKKGYFTSSKDPEIIIEKQPYKDYSIYINISSSDDNDDNYYFKEEDFYQKLVDGEFSEYLLLE
jgi:serine/threonine protein kinase